MPLYSAPIILHLEYSIQCWGSQKRVDINKLEWIQQRSTNIVSCGTPHPQPLLMGMGLLSLENRLLQDLTAAPWYLQGGDQDKAKLVRVVHDKSMIDQKSIEKKKRVSVQTEGIIFSTLRTVKQWNSLPEWLYSLHPWSFSRPWDKALSNLTAHMALSKRLGTKDCLSRGAEQDDLQKSLPTPTSTILCFCNFLRSLPTWAFLWIYWIKS